MIICWASVSIIHSRLLIIILKHLLRRPSKEYMIIIIRAYHRTFHNLYNVLDRLSSDLLRTKIL